MLSIWTKPNFCALEEGKYYIHHATNYNILNKNQKEV